MKVKFVKDLNTPQQYIAAGTVCERKDAKNLIAAGIAAAVTTKKGGSNAT